MTNAAKGLGGVEREFITKHHKHEINDNQCSSFLIKHVKAPADLVISCSSFFLFCNFACFEILLMPDGFY